MQMLSPIARHRAREARRRSVLLTAGVVALAVVCVGIGVTGQAALSQPTAQAFDDSGSTSGDAPIGADLTSGVLPRPQGVASLPVPEFAAANPVSSAGVCDRPGVADALASGADEAAVVAAGGGNAVREAIAAGAASCFSLGDPARSWVVVDKLRAIEPLEWEPSDLVSISGGQLMRQTSADAFAAMVSDASAAGMSDIVANSGYRSYSYQVGNHGRQLAAEGESAERTSARAGFSEHQLGTTVDVQLPGGSIESFGGTQTSAWVSENAWRYGFIVRYEEGAYDIVGYEAEPWHLRYIGPQLAAAYHDGGFHTLEEFFGLPAAPDYAS
ncbi:M15 family metallopeptidase [Microbacterium sp. ZW T5_56]|uniref:M15 family metallopeptidase n=1 Tax=Microbacterium sp. ZW T5_56 TaxID=3378081 RepID=UPI003852EAB4